MAATFLITPTAPSLFFRKDERFSRIMVHALNDILLRILDPFPAIRSSSNLVRSLLFYFICYKRDSFFKKCRQALFFSYGENYATWYFWKVSIFIFIMMIYFKFNYFVTRVTRRNYSTKLIIVLDWLSNNFFIDFSMTNMCTSKKSILSLSLTIKVGNER